MQLTSKQKKAAAIFAAILGGVIIAKAANKPPTTGGGGNTGGGSGSGGGRNPLYDQLIDLSNTPNANISIKSNNPLSLKISSRAYEGKITSKDNKHEAFAKFEFGLAAAIIHLSKRYFNGEITTYLGFAGAPFKLDTLQKIIRVWQSGGLTATTDTENYIAYVERKTGINRNATLTPTQDTMQKLMFAMCLYECGAWLENAVITPVKWDEYFLRAWILSDNKR